MSASEETLAYYGNLLECDEQRLQRICAPAVLIGEGSDQSPLFVRDIHDTFTYGAQQKPRTNVEIRAQGKVGAIALPLFYKIEESMTDLPAVRSRYFAPIVQFGGAVLIDKKVITGKVVALAIHPVAPTDLPAKPVYTDGDYKKFIRDQAAYFAVRGTVSLGGYSGSIAAALVAMPFVDNIGLDFDTRVRRLSKKHATIIDAWVKSENTAHKRNARAMRRPVSAGLPGSKK